MDIDFFIKIADKSILVGIGSLLLYAIYKFINYYFNSKNIIELPSLKLHPLFAYLKYNIEIKIPNLRIENINRKIIFTKFLLIKFKTFYKYFQKLLDTNFHDFINSELKDHLTVNLLNATKDYEAECKHIWIPCIVINKFSEWHAPHIEIVIRSINYISDSDFYSSKEEKVAIIFQFYITGFAQTLIDAEKTLNSLNGELDNWIKDNQKIINDIENAI